MKWLNTILIEWRKWPSRPVMWLPIIAILALAAGYAFYLYRSGRAIDFAFTAQVTSAMLGLPMLLVALIVPAAITAYEWQQGTIRNILARPVRRGPFLLGKVVFGFGYGVIILVITAAAAWLPLYMPGSVRAVSLGGDLLYTAGEMQRAYLFACGLFLVNLAAVSAFSVALGAVFRSTAAAVSAGIALWLIVDIIKYPLGIDRYIIFTYWDSVWTPFIDRADGWEPEAGSLIPGLSVAAAWFGASILIAYGAVRMRRL